jgi:hypothetical protein
MGWIHDDPLPAFESPATQRFALEQRLSSCMAENAVLREQVNRLQLTAQERQALRKAEARLKAAYVPDDKTAATLRSLLDRFA